MGKTSCPCCQKDLVLPEEAIGAKVRCTNCESKFMINTDGSTEVLEWKVPQVSEEKNETPIKKESDIKTDEKVEPPTEKEPETPEKQIIDKETLLTRDIPTPRPSYQPPVTRQVPPPMAVSNTVLNDIPTESTEPKSKKFVVNNDTDEDEEEYIPPRKGSSCLTMILGFFVLILVGIFGYIFSQDSSSTDSKTPKSVFGNKKPLNTLDIDDSKSDVKKADEVKVTTRRDVNTPRKAVRKLTDGYGDETTAEEIDIAFTDEDDDIQPVGSLTELPKSFRAYMSELDQTLQKLELNANTPDKLRLLSQRADVREAVLNFTWINAVTPEGVEKVRAYKKGEEFLKYFMGETNLIEDLFASGEVRKADRVLELLYMIYSNDPEQAFMYSKVYRNLALACALTAWGDNFEVMDLYNTYVRNHKRGELHPSFDKLSVREMRFIITPDKLLADAIPYLISANNMFTNRYGDAVWHVHYLLNNAYGESIHGSNYYKPWEHVYTRYESYHKVGGVCGSLSHYGAASAKARGLMATPGGQPGHCAVMYRHDNGRWQIGNYVGRYTGTHCSFWDLHTFGALDMFEKMYEKRSEYLNASYNIWIANHMIYAQTAPDVTFLPKSCSVYEFKGRSMPNFAMMTPYKQIQTNKIDIAQADRGNHFAMVYDGEIHCTKAGEYTISLASDDGSQLFLGEKLVIDNDGPRGMNPPKIEKITLPAGTTAFTLKYFQLDGGKGLQIKPEDKPLVYSDRIAAVFETAIEYDPVHYEAWNSFGNYLKRANVKNSTIWKRWADGICVAYADYEEIGWHLIHKYAVPAMKDIGGVSSVYALLSSCHKNLPESDRPTAEKYNFAGVLDAQTRFLDNDKQYCLKLFENILEDYYGTSNNFSTVMNWGSNLFLKDKEYASSYIKTIEQLIKKHDKGEGGFGKYLSSAIRQASESGDMAIFQQICKLYDDLNPPKNTTPFLKSKLQLLSKKGLLQTSTTSGHDNPSNYLRVIDDLQPAAFHTAKEDNPWAIVTLPGDGMVSTIYLRNVCTQNNAREVPIVVSVSTDKEKWERVFSSERAENEWLVELKKPIRAKYIKVERRAGVKNEFFHLTKIQVYGKPLY